MTKRNHISIAMRNYKMVLAIFGIFMALGIFFLPKMNTDEFPLFTIRQGLVVAVYPGASAQEIEEQVTFPLERFLFTYPEIEKSRTHSITKDGMAYIFAELKTNVEDKDIVWSKIRHGITLFKKTSLPTGVLEVATIDDFGNTSSLLIAMESDQRSPRELEHYANKLCDQLRSLPAMGNTKIIGKRNEEIAINVDWHQLSSYRLDQKVLLAQLTLQGLRTVSGGMTDSKNEAKVQVAIPYNSEYDLSEHVIWASPTGELIKLRDIADINRRYAKPSSLVNHNGKNTIIVSIEMCPGNNIIQFGKDVENIINKMGTEIPSDVKLHKITDQPRVVGNSVYSFLNDLLFSIIVVIAVMLLLFPLKTAIIAGAGVPVCTAITIFIMYILGIELNTVTLAALIVVLGMIVDDSVIVIDGYVDELRSGHSRWYSAVDSTSKLFVPMSLATLAICAMFYPMTGIIKGPLGEFVQKFPMVVTIALTTSIFFAVWVIPYFCTILVRKKNETTNKMEKIQNIFFDFLQEKYEQLLRLCFRHPAWVITSAFIAVILGVILFKQINLQLLPKAERNCFAVEVHLTSGSTIEQTSMVIDSIENVLSADKRIKSITSFIGSSSPRFHATYSPQLPSKSYAQLIVNTQNEEATKKILEKYSSELEYAFPNAYVRFKQLDYQAVRNPIEVRITCDDFNKAELYADSVKQFMHTLRELTWIHSDYDESTMRIGVKLKEDEAKRLGINQTMLSLYISSVLNGQTLTSIWEKDYKIPVVLYSQLPDSASFKTLENLQIPTSIPSVWVPLHQVATLVPEYHKSSIPHRNGLRTITVGADLIYGASQPHNMTLIKKYVEEEFNPPSDVNISFGGLSEANGTVIPQIIWSIAAGVMVLLSFMFYHFKKIDIAFLAHSAALICIFGTCLGLWIFGLDFSITAVLGLVSLIGIIVRNAIIMYEYAESLRANRVNIKEAAFEAGKRRMRPIFLTSATTALGVLPMIISQNTLWMPMGVVICLGTLFSLPFVVTVLPVAYWQVYKNSKK